jgi:hypothetical protein
MGFQVPDLGVTVSSAAKEGARGGMTGSLALNGWVSKYQIQA